jgi:lipoprotein-anchoring transpeptidase ErfK/SrfK
MKRKNRLDLNRRDFLKLSALGLSAVAMSPWKTLLEDGFPDSERLGRICTGVLRGKVQVREEPDYNSHSVGVLYEDAVVPWLQEVVGAWNSRPGRNNQRWIKTPDGYIWAAYVQPATDKRNQPVDTLPVMGEEKGMWAEVTVPYVEAILANPPARHFWVQNRIESQYPVRFYYKQIFWVDDIKTDESGTVWYRINEQYGNEGDIFWSPAEAYRPIREEEIAPIHPEVENKEILVNIHPKKQYLSCYEGETEVYFCRISSGQGENSTPLSPYGFPIWRKAISYHMGGNTARGGWDTPGIGWTCLFHGEGAAIHSTFWHNNFGERMSHGCVNVSPEDAKWIFRWSQPPVPFETGKEDIIGSGSTKVKVVNR